MAITVKYRMDWKDQFQGDDFRVDFEMEYGGSIIGLGHSVGSAFELNYNQDGWIVGSEAVMSFVVNEDDVASYDADFYEAEYKDIRVRFYINSVLKWTGWLKPENTTREFLYPEVEYRVSATDGLNDLQQVDYDGFENTGKQTLLQIIKNAIGFIGITDMDFFIQCNLYEDALMTATENVFKKLKVSNQDFYTIQDGELVPDKCHEVLQKCISSFYCKLYQSDGYWKIVNGQEYNSQSDVYDYSTLTIPSGEGDVSYDRQVDISAYHRDAQSKFELSKQPPLKNLRVIFRNKNLGGNEITTNNDFEDGGNPPPGWSNSGWDQFITTTESGNKVGNTTEVSTNSDIKYISPGSFTLAGVNTDNDAILVTFKVKLKAITLSSGSEFPMVYPSLVHPGGGETKAFARYINEIDGDYMVIQHSFNPSIDGDYTLKLYIEPRDPTSQLTYYWDDVEVIHQATANTTSDSLYKGVSSVVGYEEKEEVLYFLDSLQVSDIGALFDGATLTSSWTRFGLSAENSTLAFLFTQQYLNDHQAFHDLIQIDLYDVDEQLSFNSILTYNSKKYRFVEYSKNYDTKVISGTIVQVDNSSDVSFTFTSQSLTSSFGESIGLSARAFAISSEWSTILNTPTTLSGYGITNAYTKSESDANFAAIDHAHSAFDRASSVLTDDQVFDNIVVADGIVTGITQRGITAADIGAPDVTGSPVLNELAVFFDSNTLKSESNLTFATNKLKVSHTAGAGFSFMAGLEVVSISSTAGDDLHHDVENTATTGAGDAYFFAQVKPGSTGHPYLLVGIAATRYFAIGIDNSDGDKLTIASGTTSGTTPATGTFLMQLDSSGNVEFLGDISRTGALGAEYLRADGTTNISTFDRTSSVLTDLNVFGNIVVADGLVTNITTRDLSGVVGDVIVTGTPVDNEIAVWTDSTHIEGTTSVTFATNKLKVTAASGAGFCYMAGLTIVAISSTVGDTLSIDVEKTATSGGGNAFFYAAVHGGSSANPFIRFQVGTLKSYAFGIDNTDNDWLKIVYASIDATPAVGTDLVVFNNSGLITFHSNVGGGGTTNFLRADGQWAEPTGTGNVSNVGTPVDNQIAVFKTATTIEGDAGITWSGTLLDVTKSAGGGSVFIAENTSGAGDSNFTSGAIIASFLGDSGALRIRNTGAGDYFIYNDQQNNGVVIYDTIGGVRIIYNGVIVVKIDTTGGLDIDTGGLKTSGVTRISDSGAGTFTTGVFTSTLSATRLTSTIVTGTSPFVVASTTKVSNLNVDLLDDLSSASFVRADADDTVIGITTWSTGAIRLNDEIELYFGTTTSQSFIFAGASHTVWRFITGNLFFRNSANTDRFLFDQSGNFHADANVTGYSTTISDRRLKKKVEKISSKDALATILNLQGISFNYKRKSESRHFGFIAQDLEKILPEIVDESIILGGGKTMYKTIRNTEIIPILVEAIKAQQERITGLESQVKSYNLN